MEWSFRSEGELATARSRDLVAHGPLLPIIVKSGTTCVATNALIDTGASICVIKPKLARKLSLQITNETKVSEGFPAGPDRRWTGAYWIRLSGTGKSKL